MTTNRRPALTQRLRRGSEISHTRRIGQLHRCRAMRVFSAPSAGPDLRLAITATRHLGGAVIRNRARRRLRAAFTIAQDHCQSQLDVVVNARTDALGDPFLDLVSCARRILGGVAK